MPTAISIIIPCFNSSQHIKRCLDSLLSSISFFSDFEIIVIDDGSTDESRQILKDYEADPRIRIIFLEKNHGPARARNLGVKQTSGKYLFFLDIDTRLENDCLKTVAEKIESDQTIGALQTKLMMGESQKIETAGHFLSYFGFPYEIGVQEPEEEHQKEKLIFGARTAGLAVKRKVFEKINGFDEDYLIYGEDTDLSWRIWISGFKIIYFPRAKVHHFQKSSLQESTKYRIFYEGAKNNTANILKNASIKILFWMLPLEIFGWLTVALKLIFQKRLAEAKWIFKGLFWNLKSLNKTFKKRKGVLAFSTRNNQAEKIIFGKIKPTDLVFKGWRWLKNV